MELVFLLIGYSFLVSFFNFLFFPSTRFKWRKKDLPSLTVIIPVRNEERILSKSNSALSFCKYPALKIIYYDDGSSDGSLRIIKKAVEKDPERIKLIRGRTLPRDWLGKNYACFKAAGISDSEYLLFLDADTIINDQYLLEYSVTYLLNEQIDALSLMPVQMSAGKFSKYLIPFIFEWPIFNFMPIKLAEQFKIGTIANGQFILISKQAYETIGGHRSVKNSLIEDIDLFRKMRVKGFQTKTLFAKKGIVSYMYDDLRSTIVGFSKNLYHIFGGNPISFTIWQLLLLISLLPFILFPFNQSMLLALIMILTSRTVIMIRTKTPIITGLLLFPLELLSLFLIANISFYRNISGRVYWKDRNIYSNSSTSIA